LNSKVDDSHLQKIALGKLPYSFASTRVLIASLNEAEGIGATMNEMQHHLKDAQFLVVDGNSHDETVDIAKTFGAEIVFQEGKGKGDALRCGLSRIDSDCEYVVLTDADFTYPAEYVPGMVDILDKNPNVGMVCGNRFNGHLDLGAMRRANYVGNRLLAFAHSLFNEVYLRDPLTGLRVLRWDLVRNWKPKSDGFDIEVELNSYVVQNGYGIVEVDIPYRPRLGEKKLQLKHGVTIMKRIISEALL
jgi:glycosyltransferase involved in cell wall biosynthesis